MRGHTQTDSQIQAKLWAHPHPGLSLDELIERMKEIGNEVLEVHRDCACVGAENLITGDDHLLVGVWGERSDG